MTNHPFRFGSTLAIITLGFAIVGCGNEEPAANALPTAHASALATMAADPAVQREVERTGSAVRALAAPLDGDRSATTGEARVNNEPGKCVCCTEYPAGSGRVQCRPAPCGGC